jgi:hypothetical protein
MITHLISLQLDNLQASIEDTLSEMLNTGVDDFSTLKKEAIGVPEKIWGWFGFC